METQMKRKVEFLVADTSGFIKNESLQDLAENIITAPEVIDEVKSKPQLRRLVVLPYDLKIKEAYLENIKFVTEFSKKTGDYACLSATDIKVIALTYQLEKEKKGIDHLKSIPTCKSTIEPSNNIPDDLKNIAGFYIPKKSQIKSKLSSKNSDDALSEYESAEDEDYNSVKDKGLDNEHPVGRKVTNGKNMKELEEIKQCVDKEIEYTDDEDGEFIKYWNAEDESNLLEDENGEFEREFVECGNAEDEEDDWITPSNIAKVKSQLSSEVNENLENVTVACLTSDFAMQNVLKQIGLQVISPDGKLIKQLRTFILRCYGCFKTTSNMSKVFCPNCGNKTLKRVAVSVDENGTRHIHINFRKPLTARGKKFSLPHPKGGKHSNNPILCEDQPMPQQRPSRLSRTKNNPLDDNYIAGFSPFVTRDVYSKSAMLGIRPHVEMKHWMRKNPNEVRRKKK